MLLWFAVLISCGSCPKGQPSLSVSSSSAFSSATSSYVLFTSTSSFFFAATMQDDQHGAGVDVAIFDDDD